MGYLKVRTKLDKLGVNFCRKRSTKPSICVLNTSQKAVDEYHMVGRFAAYSSLFQKRSYTTPYVQFGVHESPKPS